MNCRAADPNPFDVEYVRSLGYGAVRLSSERGGSGSMIAWYEGNMQNSTFTDMVIALWKDED